jgi:hypothetical protein
MGTPTLHILNKATGEREHIPVHLFKAFNAAGEWEVCQPHNPAPVSEMAQRPVDVALYQDDACDTGGAAPVAPAPVIEGPKRRGRKPKAQ